MEACRTELILGSFLGPLAPRETLTGRTP
ncbi:rCG44240, partial [Rattus norvegicus]